MAGEWLKFDSSLPDKPETLAITVRMGWDDPDLTVGKLMRLFRWFDQHTTDGNAHGVTPALLDRLLSATGFVQAVADSGWIVISADGLALKNFDRHNGATAKARAQTAKRVANHRAVNGNAETVTDALAREEKRREEKKKTHTQRSAVVSVDQLVSEGCDKQAAQDWLSIRKAVLTPTAWKGVKREALKAGVTPAQAVAVAAEKQWRGFEAAWLHKPANGHALPQFDDWHRSDAGIARKGAELGMTARGGESYQSFKDRIFEKLRGVAHV